MPMLTKMEKMRIPPKIVVIKSPKSVIKFDE